MQNGKISPYWYLKHDLSSGKGVCPNFQTPAECPVDVEDFCTDDSTCPAGLKCCHTGCEYDCVSKLRVQLWNFSVVLGQNSAKRILIYVF